MSFELIDHSDTAGIRRLHDLYTVALGEDDPEGPHPSYDYFRGMVTYGLTGAPQEIWLADDTTAGCWFELPVRDNTHAAVAGIVVHPEHRRRGAGRELLAQVTRRVREHGRRVLISDAPNSSPGEAFARAVGAQPAVEELRQVLDLADVPGDLPDRAAGYELARWAGPCPAELRPEMARLRTTMNDAPTGDLDWEDETWDAERIEARDRIHTLWGIRTYTMMARHVSSGEPAAYTEVHVDGDGPWALQEDTAVVRPHRGHRLGLVLKSAMLGWLRESEPAVRRVMTWNAASNTHMRAVNERLGFRELDRWQEWQLRV
jgi:GNAT superfamily N-acetyltransferase